MNIKQRSADKSSLAAISNLTEPLPRMEHYTLLKSNTQDITPYLAHLSSKQFLGCLFVYEVADGRISELFSRLSMVTQALNLRASSNELPKQFLNMTTGSTSDAIT